MAEGNIQHLVRVIELHEAAARMLAFGRDELAEVAAHYARTTEVRLQKAQAQLRDEDDAADERSCAPSREA